MSHRTFQIIQKCCIAQAQSQFYLNLRENAAASSLGIYFLACIYSTSFVWAFNSEIYNFN